MVLGVWNAGHQSSCVRPLDVGLAGGGTYAAEGKKISSLRVQRIFKANRIQKLSAEEVLSALKTAPLVLAPSAAEAACEHFNSCSLR